MSIPAISLSPASPLAAASTHTVQPASSGLFSWVSPVGLGPIEPCGTQGPVGRNHEPTALRASWERGCPGVNGACVVVQARSQGARGSGAHPCADVQDDLQGNSWALSALLSLPSTVCGEWAGRGVAWGGICTPRRAYEKEGLSSPCSLTTPTPGTLSASGKLIPSHFSEGDGRPQRG